MLSGEIALKNNHYYYYYYILLIATAFDPPYYVIKCYSDDVNEQTRSLIGQQIAIDDWLKTR